MPENFNQPHLKNIESFSSSQTYQGRGGGSFSTKSRNHATHGSRILRKLQKVRNQFEIEKEVALPEEAAKDDVIFAEFISDWDYLLKIESLHHNDDDPSYQILNIKSENNPENSAQHRYRATVMLKEGGISTFINKVQQYIEEETGRPKNEKLFANIEDVQIAVLKAFWAEDPIIPFPENEEEDFWWEVWFRRTGNDEEKIVKVKNNLNLYGAEIGRAQLEFPEHIVRLVKGSVRQLSAFLMLLDNLAELRKPQEINDFITHPDIAIAEQRQWLEDLQSRTTFETNQQSVLINLLDTGVNNGHPLINPALEETRMYSYNSDWGSHDSYEGGGHGTGMAGLALFGDLTDALAVPHNIKIYHGLESFKIFHPSSSNDPELYGAIMEYAAATPFVKNPNNPRVFCLSVTNDHFVNNGRPSSSSASVDKIAFGNAIDPPSSQLFLVSSGNVHIANANNFPSKNFEVSVQDPGQAYNALTVGAFTTKDRLNITDWPGWSILASHGFIAPSNPSSMMWEKQWPNKPDIVMEGGNLAYDGRNSADALDPLQLLTTHKNPSQIFQTFGDTSAAVALASKLAAELRTEYPDYRAETIRGLMAHSAEWTPAMEGFFDLSREEGRRKAVRSVGFGTPIPEKAKRSANNAPTFIAENSIQPYCYEGSKVKFNEYHLYELPWPVNILRDEIMDKDVTLKVTLSYFIEPNPGNRQYKNHFQYHSHDLDFKLKQSTEELNEFKRRVSAASVESDSETEENRSSRRSNDVWTLKERVRNKGSLKKDILTISGADLATRNIIAIFPKNGWYKTRKKLEKAESVVDYSLIITLESDEITADLYTPIKTQIENIIEV